MGVLVTTREQFAFMDLTSKMPIIKISYQYMHSTVISSLYVLIHLTLRIGLA